MAVFERKPWIRRRVQDPGTDDQLAEPGGLNWREITTPGGLTGANGNDCMIVAGHRFQEMTGNLVETYSGDKVLQVNGNYTELIAGNQIIQVGASQTVTVDASRRLDVGTTAVETAGTAITKETGASRMHMNSGGVISTTGNMINTGATVNLNMAAPLSTLTGAGLLTLTGGIAVLTGGATHIFGGTINASASGDASVKGAAVKLNC
jgi:hypothetical protein